MKKRRYQFGCGIFRSGMHANRPILVAAGSRARNGANGSNTCEFLDYSKVGGQWQLCSKEFPDEMNGARITTTENGYGLILTYERSIFQFKCHNKNSCFFEKKNNMLKIDRRLHILLKVPTSFMKDCR